MPLIKTHSIKKKFVLKVCVWKCFNTKTKKCIKYILLLYSDYRLLSVDNKYNCLRQIKHLKTKEINLCPHTIPDITVVGVDLLADKNEERCHTDDYETDKYLIIRRGEDFHFQVRV